LSFQRFPASVYPRLYPWWNVRTAKQIEYAFVVGSARLAQICRRPSPAMAAGLTDHVWTLRELLEKAANAGARGQN